MPIDTRLYGSTGPNVFLLHGGPGAPGYMAPVAKVLANSFHVIEPMQRGSSHTPLTVAEHVSDLHELVQSQSNPGKSALVGHSWGAMLALAYAAQHPSEIKCLVLVGCGTFDEVSRDRLEVTRKERIDNTYSRQLQGIEKKTLPPNERMQAMGRLYLQLDSYRLGSVKDELLTCDARGHIETWQDMLRLQTEGVYPASFSAIDIPTLMLHGAYDPHPGHMIYESLKPYLRFLSYKEWQACGHYPWLEREVKEAFYATLHDWLSEQLSDA